MPPLPMVRPLADTIPAPFERSANSPTPPLENRDKTPSLVPESAFRVTPAQLLEARIADKAPPTEAVPGDPMYKLPVLIPLMVSPLKERMPVPGVDVSAATATLRP